MIFTEFFMMGGKVYAQSDGSGISSTLNCRSQDKVLQNWKEDILHKPQSAYGNRLPITNDFRLIRLKLKPMSEKLAFDYFNITQTKSRRGMLYPKLGMSSV